MRKALIRVLLAALVLPTSSVVLAQDDEADEGHFEEIIVTSTRREKNVMEVDQSIQAIPEAVLELPTFKNMSDVYNLVPGATAWSNKAPNKEGVQLRSSGIVQTGSADGSSPVGYYVDDIPYFDISTPVPPPIGTFDLQRVEILRGPQGTSYGQDASGGNVIMRTNPVDLENFGFKLRAGMTDVDNTNGSGATIGGVVNIPIAEGKFGIRLGYLQENDPGYGRVIGRPDISNPLESDRETLRVKALWQVTDKFDLEFTHSEWNTEYNTLPGLQIADTTQGEMTLFPLTSEMSLELFPDGTPTSEYEIKWTTLRAGFDFGGAELTYSMGHVDTPKKETNSEILFFGFLTTVIFNQPSESTSHELRLVSTTDSPLQWIAGVFRADSEQGGAGWTDTPDFFFRNYAEADVEVVSQSVYGEIEYSFNEKWSLQAGMRYQEGDYDEVSNGSETSFFPDFTYFTDPLFGPYGNVLPESTNKYDWDNSSYRVSLNWNPTENGLIYLSNSTAVRAPIIQSEATRDALEMIGIETYGDVNGAELLDTELGLKWTLANGRLQVEAAYVLAVWKDVPLFSEIPVPSGGLPTTSTAIGGTDADVEIIELGFNWAVTDNLTLSYAGSWTDSEVTRVPDADDVEFYPPAIVKGGEMPNYTPQTNNFGINYSRDFGSDWQIFGSLNYVTRDRPDGFDPFINPFEFNPARDEYENMGINLGIARGAWDFTFSVLNATDDSGQYLPRTANGGDDARLYGLIQPPRTYAFQVSYDGMK
ncbi:MAG: TonB-dependent receptor [Woeseiaceae bacterium]